MQPLKTWKNSWTLFWVVAMVEDWSDVFKLKCLRNKKKQMDEAEKKYTEKLKNQGKELDDQFEKNEEKVLEVIKRFKHDSKS